MSSALDFLFQGSAPSATTNYTSSQSQVPTWLQDYSQGILAQAASVASQPYQTSPVPQVAGFTPQQTQAQSDVQNLQGQYQAPLTQAENLASTSASPSALTAASSYLPTAQNDINSALAPTQAQMNPYEGNVIQQAENQATQYWNNTLQPSINNQYTAAGQYGSSANQNAANQGANLVTQNIQNTAQSALANAYTQAQNTDLQAASQTGALGQIAGGLGYEQGVLGEQGASALGSLASTGQNLGLQGAGALDTSGLEQQQLNQENLNSANSQFAAQQQYPEQQLSWEQQMLAGTATPTTVPGYTSGSATGYAPAYSASPISQSLGLYTAMNPQTSTAAARGGKIKHRRARGALDMVA